MLPGSLALLFEPSKGPKAQPRTRARVVVRPVLLYYILCSSKRSSYFSTFAHAQFSNHHDTCDCPPPAARNPLSLPQSPHSPRPLTADAPSTALGMQRRSSGSDDGDDCHDPLPVGAVSVSLSLSPNSLALDSDATSTAQATSAQTLPRPAHSHNASITSDSRRTSFDHRSQSTRSRRSGNFSSWKTATTSQNGSVDKAPLALSADSSPTFTVMATNKVDEDSDDVDRIPDFKGVSRRPRSRSPWAIGLLTLLVSLVGLGFLGTILNSSATRCLDAKGCIMSYMRPSYVKLSDFDTEHTRFGGKYSLYLYRELEVDEDAKVCFGWLLHFTLRRTPAPPLC